MITMPTSPTITNDYLFNGALVCHQHENGYHFSIDAVLLAHFCTVKKANSVVDLGAGCGVVGLVLAHRYPDCYITSVEMQEDLCTLIAANIQENEFGERMSCVLSNVAHIRQVLPSETADLVVCNPPYGVLASGRLNKGDEKTIARHEVHGGLGDFMRAAAYSAKNRGRVAFILPAARLPELLITMAECRLQPKRMQLVHSYPGGGAKLVLVEGVKNGGAELTVHEPLFVYTEQNGPYTSAVAQMHESSIS